MTEKRLKEIEFKNDPDVLGVSAYEIDQLIQEVRRLREALKKIIKGITHEFDNGELDWCEAIEIARVALEETNDSNTPKRSYQGS